MTERERLEVLAAALRNRHGLDSWLDGGHIPLLWVNVPQTTWVRELVHLTGEEYYQWDGQFWSLTDPDGLADAIAAYTAQYPATHPQPRHWGTGC